MKVKDTNLCSCNLYTSQLANIHHIENVSLNGHELFNIRNSLGAKYYSFGRADIHKVRNICTIFPKLVNILQIRQILGFELLQCTVLFLSCGKLTVESDGMS